MNFLKKIWDLKILLIFCIVCSTNFVGAQGYKDQITTIKGVLNQHGSNKTKSTLTYIYSPVDGHTLKDTIPIAKDNSFVWQLRLLYPQEIVFTAKGNHATVFVYPGSTVALEMDSTGIHYQDSINNQDLFADKTRYKRLLETLQNGDPLTNYDYNDHRLFSTEHSLFLTAFYRQITNSFSPDSTVLYRKNLEKRNLIELSKLILFNIQNKTYGFTRDVFYTRFFINALEGNQLKEFDLLWNPSLISEKYFSDKILAKRALVVEFLKNLKTDNSVSFVEDRSTDPLGSIVKKNIGKVIYVDFWAPWCGPCMKAMPASKELQKLFKKKDVAFIFLASKSANDSWTSTIANNKISGIHLNLTNEQFETLSKKYSISMIPHYLLFDRSGHLYDKNAPAPDLSDLIAERITALLNNK